MCLSFCCFFFFFNDTATTEIYTLSLNDALPICNRGKARMFLRGLRHQIADPRSGEDRKSTRLNSSHGSISYAVFCLEKNIIPLNSRHRITSETVYCLALHRPRRAPSRGSRECTLSRAPGARRSACLL